MKKRKETKTNKRKERNIKFKKNQYVEIQNIKWI